MISAAMTESPGAEAPTRVLLVEDDGMVRRALTEVLSRETFRVCAVGDGAEAQNQAETFRPDVAIVDIGLPGSMTGFDVARWLKSRSDLPVIFLTAADALDDRLRGFEIGADDYLVKPFAMSELVARLKAVLRRTGRLVSPTVEVRDLVVDESTRMVLRGENEVTLTPLEFDLLVVLAKQAGTVFSKRQLLALVWGFADFDPNLVEVHVSALRRKLEEHGPRLIHTARNAGYVLRA
jgi:two-component system OmpR family response regulator